MHIYTFFFFFTSKIENESMAYLANLRHLLLPVVYESDALIQTPEIIQALLSLPLL